MSFITWLSNGFGLSSRPASRKRKCKVQRSLRLGFECLEGRRMLSTLTVLNHLDSGAGSLRAEIAASHNGDTINFAASLAGQTITLTSGELLINHNLTIAGPGAGELTVSGNHGSRVFEVAAGTHVALSSLTISNGLAVGGDGGGILNSGTLTVSGSILSSNSANLQWKGHNAFGGYGGGIYNSGTLTVSGSTLSGNSAGDGGGIFNSGTGTVSVSGSILSGNSAAAGAGIWNADALTISNSALSGNISTGSGAGISNSGRLTVSACTLSNNVANASGGGIGNFGTGTVSVSGSTLTGNSALDNGGGIFNQGTLTVSGSTLSGNSAGIGGGGIWVGFYATGTVSGSTLSGNSAAQGGGIWNWHNVLTIENSSSITGNTAPVGFGADAYNQGVLDLDSTSMIGILDGNAAVLI